MIDIGGSAASVSSGADCFRYSVSRATLDSSLHGLECQLPGGADLLAVSAFIVCIAFCGVPALFVQRLAALD